MYKFPFHKALITGGSSGIGFATAKELISYGLDIILVARNEEKLTDARQRLQEHAKRLNKQVEISVVTLDVSNRSMVENVLIPLAINGAAPDLVVNCAGMAYPNYFEQLDSVVFDEMVQINLTGTWNILKCIVPYLRTGSHIVNVSSVAGFIGLFGYTAYSATKFGIIGLSEALRNEMAPRGIGVSVLCPPDTETPQLEMENLTKPMETRAIAGNAGIMKPERVTKAMIKGIKKNKFYIVPGIQSKFIFLVKGIVPGLIHKIIDRDAIKSSLK